MNFSNILNKIADADPEVFERTSERRDVLRRFGKGLALTAIPVALGGMLKKAYGQSTSGIVEVLNFALTLEYLEAEFYNTALDSGSLIPSGAPRGAIQTIANHENAHVAFLKLAIQNLGQTPVAKPEFDFTAQGGIPNVFSDYATFLAVAQTFEDTGVRAYKGQAGNLMGDNAILTAALNIHSVEARHASHIRQMRKANNHADIKPWITGKETGVTGVDVSKSYAGEDNTMQGGVQITGIMAGISADAATESFDEPLDKDKVMEIVTPFLATP
jgi:hypothetical protein